MIKKKLSKYLILIGAMILVLAIVVPSVAAYEGNLIDVRAHLKGKPECNATRTWGFWKTHLCAATNVFENYLGENIDIGWPALITNMNDLEGVFWAPKGEGGGGAPTLCERKQKAAVQVLAAVLTAATPNGKQLPMSLANIRVIMSGGDPDAVDDLQVLMEAFNSNAGTDGLPMGIPEGNATPQAAKDMANQTFAACP